MDLIQSRLKSSVTQHDVDGNDRAERANGSWHELAFRIMTAKTYPSLLMACGQFLLIKHLKSVS